MQFSILPLQSMQLGVLSVHSMQFGILSLYSMQFSILSLHSMEFAVLFIHSMQFPPAPNKEFQYLISNETLYIITFTCVTIAGFYSGQYKVIAVDYD
jgi:hypothetical protein